MGFFAEFSTWLDAMLGAFISSKTAAVAAALEPALITMVSVYVMGWGVLQLSGRISEPLLDGLRRIARIVLVLALGSRLWLYNALFVDTFFTAPHALAAAIVGAPDAISAIDGILQQGGDVAGALMSKGGILDGELSYYLAAFFVYAAVGLAAVYTIFLLSLAKIALTVLLALGPLFIAMLLFNASRRLFDAWIAQLANYGLIAILATLLTALMMHVLSLAAQQAAALGSGIDIATSIRVCFAAALIFLVMRQIMPIAAGLAGGVSLMTYGALSRPLSWLGQHGAMALRP